jgi:histidyl-tRNA synthetase
LVRGLDYYTKTVFEISYQSPEGKILGSLVGGGRYDALSKLLGGKPTPGCGGAAGIERIVAVLKEKNIKFAEPLPPKIFLAQLGTLAKRKSLKLLEDFRKENIEVAESFGRDSLKAQLVRANKIGVKFTLILGQREALENHILIRDMENGKQDTVDLKHVVKELEKRIKK